MRRLRRHYIKLVILVLFCGAGVLYFTRSTEDLDRQSQIQIMERSIRSIMNQVECRLPELPIDNPELMKFFHSVDKIDCGNPNDDWVMCEKSICFVKPEAIAANGEITCTFTDIIRKNDFKARYGKSVKTKEPYILQASDFVKVLCTAENGLSWFGMAYGMRDGIENTLIHKPVPPPMNNNVNPLNVLDPASELPAYFNVLMFGFDSLSRNSFMRKLSKTYKYLTKELNAIVLKGYNIVGDGTPQALTPILTGYTELEMPETRKRMSNALPVDQAYPMIWKDYEKHGYVTSFNEDIPSVGTFTYRLTGFETQPVHHYLRTYYQEAENILSSSKEHCINHEATHLTMMEYTKNFMAKYSDTPRFVFSFHGGLSHDSINLIEAADEDVVSWLETLRAKQLLDNTILIFMSDHGIRFTEIRETLQGKQEERLPFFSFAFPESFKKRFPQEYEHFVKNSERLTTPFDIHATLVHILELQNIKPTATSNELTSYETLAEETPSLETTPKIEVSDLAKHRAISLFTPVPQNRSCADAYIEPHWCACLNWQQLNVSSDMGILLKAAASILNVINNATETFRQYCEPLHLKRINWALLLKPHQELLSFKHNLDMDGYLSDLTGSSRSAEVYYQLQILVSPGDSIFEASVAYNLDNLTMHTKLSQISRVNIYGSQANCIYERNPELRKYCYCKK
ncbi:uncharacterized protein LOC119604954 [Lucilia sericata]|uniref:uncharacterized protein LOC119604954 n=1 Tax=Lucilia sericata TaxID=13632 RepID=UPI0018A86902|nr:uncharacterized protein LOC119604954 [Lucilia sericata]